MQGGRIGAVLYILVCYSVVTPVLNARVVDADAVAEGSSNVCRKQKDIGWLRKREF